MKVKHRQRNGRHQPNQKSSWLLLGLLIVGGLWGVMSLYTFAAGPVANASKDYAPEDVAAARPILAVHEMNEGPPTLFLPKNQPQPKTQTPETFYHFGAIGPQEVVEHMFIIRNTGEAPLTISRAYTTCGCTTAVISASVIPPGKVATIKLVFDAGFHDAAGQTVRRGLIIENNDPEHPQTEIWIQADVRTS